MFPKSLLALGCAVTVAAHGDHKQEPLSGPLQSLWYNTLPGDGGTQVSILNSGCIFILADFF